MAKKKNQKINILLDAKPKSNQTLNTIYFIFFLILPFVFSSQLLDQGLVSRQLFLSVILLVLIPFLSYQFISGKLKISFSPLKSFPILFYVLFLISCLTSYSGSLQESEFLIVFSKYLLGFSFLIVTVLLFVSNALSFGKLSYVLIIIGGIGLLYGIFQALLLFQNEAPFSLLLYEVKSLFGHKNLFASFLFLIFPYFLLKVFPQRRYKLVGLMSIVLILFLILIQARAVLFAFFVFFIVLLIFNRHSIAQFVSKKLMAGGILIVTISCLIVFQFGSFDFKRMTNFDSASERFSLWQHSIKLIEKSPVKGVGLGNWKLKYAEAGLDAFPNFSVQQGMTNYQRPHNDFLWVFSETGVLGGVFYFGIFLSLFYLLIRLLKKDKENQFEYRIWIAFLTGYCVIAFLDFPLERIEHQLVLLVAVARIIHLNFRFSQTLTEFSKATIGILFIILFIGSIWSVNVTKKYFEKEKLCQTITQAHSNSSWNEILELTQDSIIQTEVDAFSTPLAWYRGVALVVQNRNDEAKDAFEIAYSVAPYHIHVLNNLASCYEKLGEHQLAIKFYRKALKISKRFDESILNLSAVYFNMKKYDEAFETIKGCRDYVQDLKYQRFLPAIVRSRIDLIIKDCKDQNRIERLVKLKNEEDVMIDLFVDHKKFNCTFNEYLLIHHEK
jgi:O-antigen ligase